MRSRLKLLAPDFVRQYVRGLRTAFVPPSADEVLLRDYRFVPDDVGPTRINLIIPEMRPQSAFGGVMTGMEMFLRLGGGLSRSRPVDLRVILDDTHDIVERSVLDRCAAAAGIDASRVELISIADPQASLPTRRNDLFMPFNWWTAVNIRPLITAQAAYYRSDRLPLLYPIQEYEPHFYPFSSTHMLSREAYDGPGPLWGIFNSSLLADYFHSQGHRCERAYVFEPVINEGLRGHLAHVAKAQKRKRILVYGRPNIARNCFPALVRGLVRWAERYPEFADWELVSAGTPHPPIRLPGGREVKSIGKLPLADYGELLVESAVGVSLMSSPHPSYPPIEMAHFGMRVVTNCYGAKDLSKEHANIFSLRSIGADALAEGLAIQCARFEADPVGALTAPPINSFLRFDGLDVMDSVVNDLIEFCPIDHVVA